MILKGPYLLGANFCDGVLRGRLFPSSQTCCPSVYCICGSLVQYLLRSACAVCMCACCSSISHSTASGDLASSLDCILICELMPKRSSCGVHLVTLCGQELCANLAKGRYLVQSSCPCLLTQCRRYCSIQAFMHSVCPLVCG
jgi:hypothetical protein